MFKKTLISLAVASSLGLTGCFDSANDGGNANPSPKYSDAAGKTFPVFNPVSRQLPIPSDLNIDQVSGDGTFAVQDTLPPVTTALNQLSGASTVAPAVIQTNGQLDPSTVVAGETVHLIELAYASGEPLRALRAGEPPTLELAVSGPENLPQIRADVETLDGVSAIRILPLKPLNSLKRYVVLITTGVKDVNGDSIIQDPFYANITGAGTEDNPAKGLLDDALLPVRTLMNNLWEPLAVSYINAIGGSLSEEQIALTYSFTTSNDEKVLQYIAEPAKWVNDQLTTFLRLSAATGKASYAEAASAAQEAVDTFPASLPPNPESPLNDLFSVDEAGNPTGPCAEDQGTAAIECVSVALATQFRDSLPTPLPGVNRNTLDGKGKIEIDAASVSPVGLISAVAGTIPGAAGVLSAEGTVELPYYLGTAPGEIAGLASLNWEADDQLATTMNQVFSGLGLSLPQADPKVSTAVNYNFPFPKERGDWQEVPLLTLYPANGEIEGAVIYQHGITTDRSTALTFGTALAAQGYAVFAIDQPLHGVAPFSIVDQEDLAITLAEAGGLIEDVARDGRGNVSRDDENNVIWNESTAVEDATTIAAIIGQQFSLGVLTQIAFAQGDFEPLGGCDDAKFDGMTDPTDGSTVTGTNRTAQQAIENVTTGVCNIGGVTAPQDAMIDAISLQHTVANAGSTIPGLSPASSERHFGLYASATGAPAAMNFDPASAAGTDGSGSLFINLQNFLAARDNLRQGSIDLMNLRASLFGIPNQSDPDSSVPGAVLPIPESMPVIVSAATPVYFVGHSLGAITGAPFMAAVNENSIGDTIFTAEDFSSTLPSGFNDISAASLLTPGGGVVRLLENSPAFAPRILFGLQNANSELTQGSSSLESFLNILQASIDSADPINIVDQLSEDMILISEVAGETVIPNAADAEQWGIAPLSATLPPSVTGLPVNVTIDSFPAPLSGTKPLTLGIPDITTYSAGSHSTPVSADNMAVFGQMVCETLVTFDTALGDLPAYCSGD